MINQFSTFIPVHIINFVPNPSKCQFYNNGRLKIKPTTDTKEWHKTYDSSSSSSPVSSKERAENSVSGKTLFKSKILELGLTIQRLANFVSDLYIIMITT